MSKVYDVAEWLVYEKAIIIADIDKHVKKFNMNYEYTPFKESAYIAELRKTIEQLVINEIIKHKSYCLDIEEIYDIVSRDEIIEIIQHHYVREWLLQ